MDNVRVLVCRMGQRPAIEHIVPTLKNLQAVVDGHIGCVAIVDDGRGDGSGVGIWVNEEGRYTKPFHRDVPSLIPAPDPAALEAIFGSAVVVFDLDDRPPAAPGTLGVHEVYGDFLFSRSDGKGEMASLTDEDLRVIAELLS